EQFFASAFSSRVCAGTFPHLTRRHWGENAVTIAGSGPQSLGSGWGWVADAVTIAANGPQCLGGGGGAQHTERSGCGARPGPRTRFHGTFPYSGERCESCGSGTIRKPSALFAEFSRASIQRRFGEGRVSVSNANSSGMARSSQIVPRPFVSSRCQLNEKLWPRRSLERITTFTCARV